MLVFIDFNIHFNSIKHLMYKTLDKAKMLTFQVCLLQVLEWFAMRFVFPTMKTKQKK